MASINTGVLTDAVPLSAENIKMLERYALENSKTFAYLDDSKELCFLTSGPVTGIKELAWHNTYVLSNDNGVLFKKHYRRDGLRSFYLDKTFTKESYDAEWTTDSPVLTNYYDAVYWNPDTALAGVGVVFHEDNTVTAVGYLDDERFLAVPSQDGNTYDSESLVAAEDFSTITDSSNGQLFYRSHEVEGIKYNEEYVNENIIDGDLLVTTITISELGIAHAKQYYHKLDAVIMEQDFPVQVTNAGLFVRLMGKVVGGVSSDGDYIWMNAYASDLYPNKGEMFVRRGAMSDSEIPYGKLFVIDNYMYSYKCKYDGESWIPDTSEGWGVKAYSSEANPDDILDSIDGIPVTDIYNNGLL